ncbi:MAG: imidazoleglycerol-phosphate dehydratase HisB [Gammaproteobacteria bacterium]|nr:imidazoleglycerol-phosphate dehydratase HisB [Gammaproteobacteria bacterium]
MAEGETVRRAEVVRKTLETEVSVRINLDGSGEQKIATGLPFLDHMLSQVARHGHFDLDIRAKGDLEIDGHHTAEDIGITLGQALRQAVGEKRGIQRYGHAYVPLDEALSRVVVDLSGRPGLEFHADFGRERIGDFDTELFFEFFQGLVNHAQLTLHLDTLRGRNGHHIAETLFKAFGRALRQAVALDPQLAGALPSTKGTLV